MRNIPQQSTVSFLQHRAEYDRSDRADQIKVKAIIRPAIGVTLRPLSHSGGLDAREQDVKQIRWGGSHIKCKLPGRERIRPDYKKKLVMRMRPTIALQPHLEHHCPANMESGSLESGLSKGKLEFPRSFVAIYLG